MSICSVHETRIVHYDKGNVNSLLDIKIYVAKGLYNVLYVYGGNVAGNHTQPFPTSVPPYFSYNDKGNVAKTYRTRLSEIIDLFENSENIFLTILNKLYRAASEAITHLAAGGQPVNIATLNNLLAHLFAAGGTYAFTIDQDDLMRELMAAVLLDQSHDFSDKDFVNTQNCFTNRTQMADCNNTIYSILTNVDDLKKRGVKILNETSQGAIINNLTYYSEDTGFPKESVARKIWDARMIQPVSVLTPQLKKYRTIANIMDPAGCANCPGDTTLNMVPKEDEIIIYNIGLIFYQGLFNYMRTQDTYVYIHIHNIKSNFIINKNYTLILIQLDPNDWKNNNTVTIDNLICGPNGDFTVPNVSMILGTSVNVQHAPLLDLLIKSNINFQIIVSIYMLMKGYGDFSQIIYMIYLYYINSAEDTRGNCVLITKDRFCAYLCILVNCPFILGTKNHSLCIYDIESKFRNKKFQKCYNKYIGEGLKIIDDDDTEYDNDLKKSQRDVIFYKNSNFKSKSVNGIYVQNDAAGVWVVLGLKVSTYGTIPSLTHSLDRVFDYIDISKNYHKKNVYTRFYISYESVEHVLQHSKYWLKDNNYTEDWQVRSTHDEFTWHPKEKFPAASNTADDTIKYNSMKENIMLNKHFKNYINFQIFLEFGRANFLYEKFNDDPINDGADTTTPKKPFNADEPEVNSAFVSGPHSPVLFGTTLLYNVRFIMFRKWYTSYINQLLKPNTVNSNSHIRSWSAQQDMSIMAQTNVDTILSTVVEIESRINCCYNIVLLYYDQYVDGNDAFKGCGTFIKFKTTDVNYYEDLMRELEKLFEHDSIYLLRYFNIINCLTKNPGYTGAIDGNELYKNINPAVSAWTVMLENIKSENDQDSTDITNHINELLSNIKNHCLKKGDAGRADYDIFHTKLNTIGKSLKNMLELKKDIQVMIRKYKIRKLMNILEKKILKQTAVATAAKAAIITDTAVATAAATAAKKKGGGKAPQRTSSHTAVAPDKETKKIVAAIVEEQNNMHVKALREREEHEKALREENENLKRLNRFLDEQEDSENYYSDNSSIEKYIYTESLIKELMIIITLNDPKYVSILSENDIKNDITNIYLDIGTVMGISSDTDIYNNKTITFTATLEYYSGLKQYVERAMTNEPMIINTYNLFESELNRVDCCKIILQLYYPDKNIETKLPDTDNYLQILYEKLEEWINSMMFTITSLLNQEINTEIIVKNKILFDENYNIITPIYHKLFLSYVECIKRLDQQEYQKYQEYYKQMLGFREVQCIYIKMQNEIIGNQYKMAEYYFDYNNKYNAIMVKMAEIEALKLTISEVHLKQMISEAHVLTKAFLEFEQEYKNNIGIIILGLHEKKEELSKYIALNVSINELYNNSLSILFRNYSVSYYNPISYMLEFMDRHLALLTDHLNYINPLTHKLNEQIAILPITGGQKRGMKENYRGAIKFKIGKTYKEIILGKEKCIYTMKGSKKKYVKYKHEYLTVKEYIKLKSIVDKEPTKKTKEPTKKTPEPTKKTKEHTKKTKEPIQKIKEPTKKTPEPTPKSKEPTKKTPEPTKKTKEPTKKTPEPTKKTKEPTKKTKEPTKKTEEPTKKTKEPTKKTPEPSKKTPEPTKKTEEPTKKTKEPTKKTKEPSKKTPEPSKKTKEPSKKTKEPSKKTKEPTKKTKEPSKKTPEPTKKTKESIKKTK
jgi:hypothetical protein